MGLSWPGSWKKGAANAAEFDAWDYAWRKRLGFFAGLKFFERNNQGGMMIAARHWPHKLCWDWFISLDGWRKGYDGPRIFRVWLPACGSTGVQLWHWTLRLHWQDSGWMGACGPRGDDAPKIVWNHHIAAERANSPALH